MLSTTQTHPCPTCGLPAVVRMCTTRQSRGAERYGFETHLTFSCRGGCQLTQEQIQSLCGLPVPPAEPAR